LGGRHILAARVTLSWPAAASRAFSVSTRVLGEGANDVLLAQKLGEEYQYEESSVSKDEAEPEFLKTFKGQGIWQIEDISGADEVTLSRKFGNEDIRIMFSIADIQDSNEQENFEEEREEKGEEGSEEEPIHSYPIRVSMSITKSSSRGSINVDTMCQDGSFIVDNISYYPDAHIGTSLTAEADWKRRGLYLGPQFDTLDVSVQEEFEKFLLERGIAESLALFIPEYAEYKEQKEYVRWLENVKKFVEL
jgi:complement component 1 Q subcomponent-binding protein